MSLRTFARRRERPPWNKGDLSSCVWCLILQFNQDSRRLRTGQEPNSTRKQRSVVSDQILNPECKIISSIIDPYRWYLNSLRLNCIIRINICTIFFTTRKSWISWPLAYLMQAKEAADTSELSLRYLFIFFSDLNIYCNLYIRYDFTIF